MKDTPRVKPGLPPEPRIPIEYLDGARTGERMDGYANKDSVAVDKSKIPYLVANRPLYSYQTGSRTVFITHINNKVCMVIPVGFKGHWAAQDLQLDREYLPIDKVFIEEFWLHDTSIPDQPWLRSGGDDKGWHRATNGLSIDLTLCRQRLQDIQFGKSDDASGALECKIVYRLSIDPIKEL